MKQDYYKILGIKRDATQKAAKSAYHQLARKLHPDVNPSKSAAERFKKVNEAYEVIGDSAKRKKYDKYGADWKHADRFEQAGFGGAGMGERNFGGHKINLNDLFSGLGDVFGFEKTASQQRQRTQVVETNVRITLEEMYAGTYRNLTLNTPDGSRNIQVKIPAGITDGGKLAVRPNGVTVNIKVTLKPHAEFVLDGLNLRKRVEVPLRLMLIGGEITVATLAKAVVLTIPKGTQNGRVFRLRGRGMPKLNSNDYGDLLIEAVVKLPVPLSAADQALLEQMSFVKTGAKR